MGTTATALVLSKEKAVIAHVGDSRVYHLRDGQIVSRTFDHSKVFELVRRGVLTEEQARLSPSQRDLDMEQILEPLERAMELTPILGELGYNEGHSFNGLLQTTTDGGPSITPVDGNGAATGETTVFEAGLTTVADTSETGTGSITLSADDGLDSLRIDGTLVTPPLSDSILAGVTRDSVLTLARDLGLSQTAVVRIWHAFGLKPHQRLNRRWQCAAPA